MKRQALMVLCLVVVMAWTSRPLPANVYTAKEKFIVSAVQGYIGASSTPMDRMCCPVPPTPYESFLRDLETARLLLAD